MIALNSPMISGWCIRPRRVLDGDGRSFADVKEERIGTAPAESAGQDDADDDDAEDRPRRRRRKPREAELVESVANVIVGYGVAVLTQLVAFPCFELPTHLDDTLAIGAIFTVISIGRGFALRRLFEAFCQPN